MLQTHRKGKVVIEDKELYQPAEYSGDYQWDTGNKSPHFKQQIFHQSPPFFLFFWPILTNLVEQVKSGECYLSPIVFQV